MISSRRRALRRAPCSPAATIPNGGKPAVSRWSGPGGPSDERRRVAGGMLDAARACAPRFRSELEVGGFIRPQRFLSRLLPSRRQAHRRARARSSVAAAATRNGPQRVWPVQDGNQVGEICGSSRWHWIIAERGQDPGSQALEIATDPGGVAFSRWEGRPHGASGWAAARPNSARVLTSNSARRARERDHRGSATQRGQKDVRFLTDETPDPVPSGEGRGIAQSGAPAWIHSMMTM